MAEGAIKKLLRFGNEGGRHQWMKEIVEEVLALLSPLDRRAHPILDGMRHLILALPLCRGEYGDEVSVMNKTGMPLIWRLTNEVGDLQERSPYTLYSVAAGPHGSCSWTPPANSNVIRAGCSFVAADAGARDVDIEIRLLIRDERSAFVAAFAAASPQQVREHQWAQLCSLFPECGLPAQSSPIAFVRHYRSLGEAEKAYNKGEPRNKGQSSKQGHSGCAS